MKITYTCPCGFRNIDNEAKIKATQLHCFCTKCGGLTIIKNDRLMESIRPTC
jgi:hypothetical protein